jgi:outer membrane lipoprotein-sorting protein
MRRGTFVRWGVPIAAVAVIGAAIGAGPVIAAVSGEPVLPERSAAQLLADAVAATSKDGGIPPMSGTVQQTASLGLPALPQTGSASPLSLLSGSHEVKVWYGAEDKVRVAMPTQLNETNLIINGGQAWYWDSATNTATKLTIKQGADEEHKNTPVPTPADLTPQQVAERVLAQADEHTAVRVINTAEVAGRPVYQLVLAPKDESSLVQEIRIAVDGENYVPLQVQVYAKGSAEPAYQVGFTQVTFTPPAAENFTFTPPKGAKVEEQTLGENDLAPKAEERAEQHAKDVAGELKVVGEGWTSVAVVPFSLSDLTAQQEQSQAPESEGGDERFGGGGDPAALLDSVLKSATPVSGTWGSGKLIRTKLVTALLTDDGRLLVGAVTPEEITKAAGTK